MAALAPLLRMSAAVFVRSPGNYFSAERIVICFSFGCGVASAALDLFALPTLPPQRILFGLFLACVLFLSASGFGLFFLPAGMFLFGHLSERAVLCVYSAANGNYFHEPGTLILSTILVPFVLLTAFHGLCASSSLRKALLRASPTARSLYLSELASTALYSLFSLALIFYFS